MAIKTPDDVRVTFRVDKDLKERAESLFDRLGMNMSTALNVFLRKAVNDEAIPFPVNAKNALVGLGNAPAEITSAFENAVKREIAEHQRNGFPVAGYDKKTRRAYLESTDGTREYVNG